MSGGDLIDFDARLRKKKMEACDHDNVEVAEDEPSLTCTTCGREIDPWWFIRRQADRREQWNAESARLRKRRDEWIARAHEDGQRILREIEELRALKNKLANEQVNGVLLGSQVRRSRRKRA